MIEPARRGTRPPSPDRRRRRLPAAHLPAWRVARSRNLQPRPHQVPVQAGRPARLGQVAAHQLGRGHATIADNLAEGAETSRARTRSGSRPTPARWPDRGRGRRRLSALPARSAPRPATSRETTRATAPRRRAGTTCSSTPPTQQRRRLFRRPRVDRLPERQGDRALGAITSPRPRSPTGGSCSTRATRTAPRLVSIDPRFTPPRAASDDWLPDPARRRHGPGRRRSSTTS